MRVDTPRRGACTWSTIEALERAPHGLPELYHSSLLLPSYSSSSALFLVFNFSIFFFFLSALFSSCISFSSFSVLVCSLCTIEVHQLLRFLFLLLFFSFNVLGFFPPTSPRLLLLITLMPDACCSFSLFLFRGLSCFCSDRTYLKMWMLYLNMPTVFELRVFAYVENFAYTRILTCFYPCASSWWNSGLGSRGPWRAAHQHRPRLPGDHGASMCLELSKHRHCCNG